MRYIGNKTKLLDKLERLLVKKGLTKKEAAEKVVKIKSII